MKNFFCSAAQSNAFLLGMVVLLLGSSPHLTAYARQFANSTTGWEHWTLYALQALAYGGLSLHYKLKHSRAMAWVCAIMSFASLMVPTPLEARLVFVPLAIIATLIGWVVELTSPHP